MCFLILLIWLLIEGSMFDCAGNVLMTWFVICLKDSFNTPVIISTLQFSKLLLIITIGCMFASKIIDYIDSKIFSRKSTKPNIFIKNELQSKQLLIIVSSVFYIGLCYFIAFHVDYDWYFWFIMDFFSLTWGMLSLDVFCCEYKY